MNKILIILLVISGYTSRAQTTIYFNFDTKKMSSDVAGANEITNLDKSTKYVIKTINFNPFKYNANTKVTATDNVKGIFEIFSGLILKGEIPSADPADFTMAMNDTDFLTIRNRFISDYEMSIRLYNSVYNEEFNSANPKNIKLFSTSNQLLNSYFAYIRQPAAMRDANKLPAEITTNEATILKMNGFNNNVDYFVNKQNCQIELAQFEPKGTSINIEIKFLPRDEKSELNNVDYSNNFTIKSKIKVSFSSGIFVSNNLKKQYYIDDSDTGAFFIKEEGRGNFLPGVMALAHLNLTELSEFGLNLGAGIDIDKTPHLLFGFSYNIANSGILINSGLDLAYLENLTDKFKADVNYTSKPEVSYKKEFIGGFWFGISYKF